MIRVLIERHCQPAKEVQLRGLMIELRMAAMRQPGYISGETLREADNPSAFMVITPGLPLKLGKHGKRPGSDC